MILENACLEQLEVTKIARGTIFGAQASILLLEGRSGLGGVQGCLDDVGVKRRISDHDGVLRA
jgi:hypothetical protein